MSQTEAREELRCGEGLLGTGEKAEFQDRSFRARVFSSATHCSGCRRHCREAVTGTSRAPALLGRAWDPSSLASLRSGGPVVSPVRERPGRSLLRDAPSQGRTWLPSSPGSGVRVARVSWVRQPPSFKQVPLRLASLACLTFTELIPIILVNICF